MCHKNQTGRETCPINPKLKEKACKIMWHAQKNAWHIVNKHLTNNGGTIMLREGTRGWLQRKLKRDETVTSFIWHAEGFDAKIHYLSDNSIRIQLEDWNHSSYFKQREFDDNNW